MRRLVCMLFILLLPLVCFAESERNWTEWNITYYDYSKESTCEVLDVFIKKMDLLQKMRGCSGMDNPLVRGTKIYVLYNIALRLWSDYIKFALCDAEGLDNISDETIKIFNDIFPTLHKFAYYFFNGDYTNGKAPVEFLFLDDKSTVLGVMTSLQNMEWHIDIAYYVKNPSDIPRLSKNSSYQMTENEGIGYPPPGHYGNN